MHQPLEPCDEHKQSELDYMVAAPAPGTSNFFSRHNEPTSCLVWFEPVGCPACKGWQHGSDSVRINGARRRKKAGETLQRLLSTRYAVWTAQRAITIWKIFFHRVK